MLVPIKILLDEAKKPFVPYVPTNAVLVQGTDKTLQDELDNIYTKEETNELVNTGDANTLSSAKAYTDEVVNTGNTNTLNAAKEYTDEAVSTGDTNTLNSAKEYTDDALANFEGGSTEQQVDEKINTAKSDLTSAYTAADTNILNSARSYTDSKFNDAGSVVVNPIATIKEELTLQIYGQSVRLYNSALEDISDGKMFTVTFPKSNTSYTYLELYYKYRNSSGTGWRITNVQDYSLLSGQTCIVQARMGDSDYTFTVIDVLTSTESVKKNLKDVLVTTCKSPNQQYVGQTYYVYDEALRNPVHNQLFIITIPGLHAADKYVRFWYQNQGGSMSGYLLTNAKSNDISNQKILMQANVEGDNTTFELVSILPTKELISNKISDLLITDCGTGGSDRSGNTYYVYSESFGVPVDKQLFTIKMPSLPASEYYVRFYNRSQNSSYTGWLLNNVKAKDVSNQLLLVQASVVEDVISFNLIAGKNIDTTINLEEAWEPIPIINSAIGTVSNQCLSNKYIGYNQYKLSGFFSITNTGGSTTGYITIDPLLLPSPVGTPAKGLFVLKFDGASQHIEPIFINWTGEAFVLNNATITQNESAYYFIVPQVIKFE